MSFYRRRKKSILIDAKTGERHVLSSPRYGRRNRKECQGGCQPERGPRKHDSCEEATYCDKLMILVRVQEIRSYRPQVTYPLQDRHGKPCGSMRVDFVVTMPDGSEEIREYKGKLFGTLREFHLLRALFSWNYPDVIYKTVTEKDLI